MRFLIASGGSGHSQQAVAAGLYLAHLVGAEVVLLAVEARSSAPTGMEKTPILGTDQATVPVEVRHRRGRVDQAILEELRDGAYDLLLLGERRTHRLLTRILGSVVDKVSGRASCPVLIVRGQVDAFHRVLICDSGRSAPGLIDHLVASGLHALFAPDAAVTLLHVMSQISVGPAVEDRQLHADTAQLTALHAPEGLMLEDRMAKLAGIGLKTRPKIRHGPVVREIVAEADTGRADLVVIGAHAVGDWQARLLADLARQIVHQVNRSLLIVR